MVISPSTGHPCGEVRVGGDLLSSAAFGRKSLEIRVIAFVYSTLQAWKLGTVDWEGLFTMIRLRALSTDHRNLRQSGLYWMRVTIR